jgi:hypothetical protein
MKRGEEDADLHPEERIGGFRVQCIEMNIGLLEKGWLSLLCSKRLRAGAAMKD